MESIYVEPSSSEIKINRKTHLVLLARLAATLCMCWSTLNQSTDRMNLLLLFFLMKLSSISVSAMSCGCMLVFEERSWIVICQKKV